MKFKKYYLMGCLLSLMTTALGIADTEPRLFAAMAMTKEQEASALPTASGVFIHDEKSGEWERIGPAVQAINSMAVDPSDPDTLYLACGNGILRSQDGGEHWRMVTGWRESDITDITIDPENGNHVYAASYWGVTVSMDGGDTWTARNDGLKETYSRAIVVDMADPSRLILGCGAGVYISNNRAKSWEPAEGSTRSAIFSIDRSPINQEIWIAGSEGDGVYMSWDDGKTWNPVADEFRESNVYSVSCDPGSVDQMAAGGWGIGVLVSQDRGHTWHHRASGLPSSNVTQVTFDASGSDRLWASTFEEGTWYSDDFGVNWHEGGLLGAYVHDLDFVEWKTSKN